MTARDVTGFDAIFSTGFFATFSRFYGARLAKLHILEKKQKKSSGEPPVETAPRNCRFLSLVVVERALTYGALSTGHPKRNRWCWTQRRPFLERWDMGAKRSSARYPLHIVQYPFEIVSQRGVSHPFALFS